MGWVRAFTAVTCNFCDVTIPVGTAYRQGERVPSKWCALCARERLNEQVPDVLAQPEVPGKLQLPESFARFSRVDTGAQLKRNILSWRRDGKAEAQGESD